MLDTEVLIEVKVMWPVRDKNQASPRLALDIAHHRQPPLQNTEYRMPIMPTLLLSLLVKRVADAGEHAAVRLLQQGWAAVQ